MLKKYSFQSIFLVVFFGDFNLSLLQVASISYGVQLGASPSQNGLIGAAYGISYLIMAALLGRLGDKLSRKTSLLCALISQILVSLYIVAFASTVELLILGQFLLGCAYGFFWPTIEASISENTEKSMDSHRRGISNFCISWSLGYTVGPFLAGIFSDIFINVAFILALFVYFTGLIIIVLFIPNVSTSSSDNEKFVAHKGVPLPLSANYVNNETIDVTHLNKINLNSTKYILVRILFGMLIYAMCGKIALTYFPDYASRPNGLNFSGTLIGLILFLFGIGRTAYFVLSRVLTSSLRRITFSYFVISVLLTSMLFIHTLGILIMVFIAFGLCSGLIYKSSLELLLYYEKEAKGAKAGLFESAIGLGSALTPFIAGLFAELLLILPFMIFAIIAFIVFLCNLIFDRIAIKVKNETN
ncbi:MAG: membrane protein of unknown function [Promethearchaeota archaeon]|nr:MAG: membrane protein of unknown function [Candidatus Lokiarchaeota archaeon]